MRRRALLAAGAMPGAADFPPVIELGGRRLVLNGTGVRSWSPLRITVYHAALYLERPSDDAAVILAGPGPALVRARYLRAVGLDDVVAAWAASFQAICDCAMPAVFRDWLRPLAGGDAEDQFFADGGARCAGRGRPDAWVAGAAAGTLLAAWIGPQVPPATLRRGLLGGR